jgi:catechol 2,3-dioxygenase-like lactoylglutathione lyase family enzyme
MLKDHSSSAIVAVKDYDRAKRFYRDMLGLDLIEEMGGQVMTFETGATNLFVYVSEEAGTNHANAVVWGVGDDVDAIVSDLRSRGVTFEHYEDMRELSLDGDIHRVGDMKLVWLKDPDGNILHLNNM